MQTLQGRLEQLIEQVQVAPVPVSLQALPAVSKPAFKRTRRAPKSKARTYKA
ncbi:DNA topoisomerase III [Vibrio cholerae]|nr:DNA topoisomerase III [Vibrio cholerae]